MFRSVRISCSVFLVWWLFSFTQLGWAAIKVLPEPGTPPNYVEKAQTTMAAFNAIVKEQMGVTLDQDVKMFLCPNEQSYRQALLREFMVPEAEAEVRARITSGTSSHQYGAIAIQLTYSDDQLIEDEFYMIAAHELFHQLEYQLCADKKDQAAVWMIEGAADYVASMVAEKVGNQSREKWKQDRINALRRAEKPVAPQTLLAVSREQWTKLIEDRVNHYEMADLMLCYLLEQTRGNELQLLANYFRAVGSDENTANAFTQTFGISEEKMAAEFELWLAQGSPQTAEITVLPVTPAAQSAVEDYKQAVERSRTLFRKSWGRDINESVRILLCSGKSELIKTAMKEFGWSEEAAGQKLKDYSHWYVGSTGVFDVNSQETKEQRYFFTAVFLISRFVAEYSLYPQLALREWLNVGIGLAFAGEVIENARIVGKGRYHELWLKNFAQSPFRPKLGELGTSKNWDAAYAKSGLTVWSTATLAVQYLAGKYGAEAVGSFLRQVKQTGNLETAFRTVFGTTIEAFEAEFDSYIEQQAKKATQ